MGNNTNTYMTNRERMNRVLRGEKPDRMPAIEWAGWWDKTIRNWENETNGLSKGLSNQQISAFFDLDEHHQFWFPQRSSKCPQPAFHGAPILYDEKDYLKLKKEVFSEEFLDGELNRLRSLKSRHDAGEIFIWFSFEGFFWFPRTLFGIENHFYAFEDYPDLMKEMNCDQANYINMVAKEAYNILTPEFVTLAEDMSYNNGPMLSKAYYDEFMAPYYQMVMPTLHQNNVPVLIDTDGQVEPLIPWFRECGIDGILPLERQSLVDVNRIRGTYPEFILLGGFDKRVIKGTEAEVRQEFERLLPVIKSGRFIASCDHQTPPDVDLEHYRTYSRLLKEYSVFCSEKI